MRPSIATVALLMPASSPSSWSRISVREAMALRPAEVHAQQHLGPVGGLGAAGAGADGDDRVRRVVRRRRTAARCAAARSRARSCSYSGLDAGLHAPSSASWPARPARPGRCARASEAFQVVELVAQAVGLAQHASGRVRWSSQKSGADGWLLERRRGEPACRVGQSRPEVAWIRAARSRMAACSISTSRLELPGAAWAGVR